MKKYDVPLALASTKSIDKLALARMLIDMMELDELYEPLNYKGSFGNLKKLDTEEYFDMLGIVPEERMHKIEAEDADEFKNYDVALSMSAGNIDDARQVMELLKSLNPKKPLDSSDFETLDKVSHIIDEITDKMMNAKEMLERKNLRDKLAKHLGN